MLFLDHVITSFLFSIDVSIKSTRGLDLHIDVSILKYGCPWKWIHNGFKMYTNGCILCQMDTKCVQMDKYWYKWIQNVYKWIHMDTKEYIWIQMDTSLYQFKSTNCAETPLPLLFTSLRTSCRTVPTYTLRLHRNVVLTVPILLRRMVSPDANSFLTREHYIPK